MVGRWLLSAIWVVSMSGNARTGCFDDWFCVSTAPQTGVLRVYLTRPHPVVVSVYSDAITPSPYTVALTSTTPHIIGKLAQPETFWSDMRTKWTGGKQHAQHDDTVIYGWPLQPVGQYPIVQGVNGRFSHQGASRYAFDFAAPPGTFVFAARSGVVIDLQQHFSQGGPHRRYAPYANYISILHDDGTTGEYYHLQPHSITVAIGETVNKGQHIGATGNTGFTSLPHLHFAVYTAQAEGRYTSVPIRFAQP